MTDNGLAWLRSREATLARGMVKDIHDAREVQRLASMQALHEQIEEGDHHTYRDKAISRGRVRIAPGLRGEWGTRSRGSVAWYVPDGAVFDLHEENSTRTVSFHGEKPWMDWMVSDEAELERYHRRADSICVEEYEGDWDVAPMRGAARNPTSEFDVPWFGFHSVPEDVEP